MPENAHQFHYFPAMWCFLPVKFVLDEASIVLFRMCAESLIVGHPLCYLSLSGCGALTGETPQRLLRDTVKDASEKAKEAAKNLASAAAVPQKPQQYIWQDSMWRSGQVMWTHGTRQCLFGHLDLNGGFILWMRLLFCFVFLNFYLFLSLFSALCFISQLWWNLRFLSLCVKLYTYMETFRLWPAAHFCPFASISVTLFSCKMIKLSVNSRPSIFTPFTFISY